MSDRAGPAAASAARRRSELAAAGGLFLAAGLLWYLVFVAAWSNFWLKISVASAILAGGSLLAMGSRRRTLLRMNLLDGAVGVGSAIVLYVIFLLARLILIALFPAAQSAIGSVYVERGSVPLWLVGALLVAVTGPAEEIYWRGMLQHSLADRTGRLPALLVTSSCYALVHLWTLNVPLVLAALTAGLFWGALYLWRRRIMPVVISHSLWTLAIFVLFPVG